MARYSPLHTGAKGCVPRLCGDGPTSDSPLRRQWVRSPPVRGWPDVRLPTSSAMGAFPACAGMARRPTPHFVGNGCVPRLCGDGPDRWSGSENTTQRSPPVRGWPDLMAAAGEDGSAFPACAGMARGVTPSDGIDGRVPRLCGDGPILPGRAPGQPQRSPPVRGWPVSTGAATGVPRLCGDGPFLFMLVLQFAERSPPVRGWPGASSTPTLTLTAFPACAGMARRRWYEGARARSVPRLCGDGPKIYPLPELQMQRSPPVRGWPDPERVVKQLQWAFPACAGMARDNEPVLSRCGRVPRLCGDGPTRNEWSSNCNGRSPPVRGWPATTNRSCPAADAFPACAGMARKSGHREPRPPCVPRLCGDGPHRQLTVPAQVERSPPVRGWPGSMGIRLRCWCAFPACAGMARLFFRAIGLIISVPRLCGDGPKNRNRNKSEYRRSPPVRGWPDWPFPSSRHRRAFPACAGMARQGDWFPYFERCVPRLCGDGPVEANNARNAPSRSPPVRGWPAIREHPVLHAPAFPACAGMARLKIQAGFPSPCVPRLCGDGPEWETTYGKNNQRSPPVRGWPVVCVDAFLGNLAFPACVGMTRRIPISPLRISGVPRLCGDGPKIQIGSITSQLRSPPVRGWPVL